MTNKQKQELMLLMNDAESVELGCENMMNEFEPGSLEHESFSTCLKKAREVNELLFKLSEGKKEKNETENQ